MTFSIRIITETDQLSMVPWGGFTQLGSLGHEAT